MENMMITTNENDIRQPFATVTTTIHNPFSYCAGHNSIIGEMTIVSKKWEIFGFDIVPFIDRTHNVTYNCSKHCLHLHCYVNMGGSC